MFGGIKKCCNFALEFNNGILLVVWMSGLVTGLQNRLRRFESANHLESVNAAMCSHFFCLFFFSWRPENRGKCNLLVSKPCCF